MRFRIFGKVVRLPRAAVIAIAALVLAAIGTVGYFGTAKKELPSVISGNEATQASASPPETGLAETVASSGPAGDPRASPVLSPDAKLVAVYVSGAVVNIGVRWLPEGSIIQDAIDACGGLADGADTGVINPALRISDGMHIHIPEAGGTPADWLPGTAGTPRADGAFTGGASPVPLVNINEATLAELTRLSGIGESTAMDIISYREEHGGFRTIEEIMNVPGIKEAKFGRIKKFITV